MSGEPTITATGTPTADPDQPNQEWDEAWDDDPCDCPLCQDPPNLTGLLINPEWVWIIREDSQTLVTDRFVILNADAIGIDTAALPPGVYDLTDPGRPYRYADGIPLRIPALWESATGPRVGTDPRPVRWTRWTYTDRRIGFLPGDTPVLVHDAWLNRIPHWQLDGGIDGSTLAIAHPRTGRLCGAVARMCHTPDAKPVIAAIAAQLGRRAA